MENVVDRILRDSFESLTYEERKRIKAEGRPKPAIDLVQKWGCRNRSFQVSWYEKVKWLTGSMVTKRMYCWPCLLFRPANGCLTWSRTGFDDLRNFDRSCRRHGNSKQHVSASARLNLLGRGDGDTIDESVRVQVARHNETVRENRAVLKRFIDTASFLGRHEWAFRGYDKGRDSDNKGNYKELVKVIARYDEVLTRHFESSAVLSGVSDTIQNDLIFSISATVLEEIKTEVVTAPFFAWQIDETRGQLSIILRYVDVMGIIQERFIGFFDVSGGGDAQSVVTFLRAEMEKFNFQQKLVAQMYDGAVVMASAMNELQAKVKEMAPSAVFVHCYVHNLSVVLSQGVKCVPEARIFFATLAGFSSFFAKSSKMVALIEATGFSQLLRNGPNWWNFTSRIVNTVANNHQRLMETFARIVDSQDIKDDDTIDAAWGFIKTLQDFGFTFMLLIFDQILSETDVMFDIVQLRAMDVVFCKSMIQKLINFAEEKKSEASFLSIYEKAASLAEDPEDLLRRKLGQRGRSLSQTQDPKQHYRAVYIAVVDNLVEQIKQRYADLDIIRFFELLNPKKFEEMGRVFPEDAFRCLQEGYGHFFDAERLKYELKMLYSDRELQGDKGKLCDFLTFFKAAELDKVMPQSYKLMCLVATIGATSAGIERSSSCLKRVKTYTCNTVDQEHLKNLAVLAIERKLVKSLEKNLTGMIES